MLKLRARWPRLCTGWSREDAGSVPLSLRSIGQASNTRVNSRLWPGKQHEHHWYLKNYMASIRLTTQQWGPQTASQTE